MTQTIGESALSDGSGRNIIRPHWHHFGTATTRNTEMEDWYRNVLGMEVALRSIDPLPTMTFVTNDVAHHRGGFFTPPFLKDDPEKLQHARIQHLAWEYDSIDDLLETWERIGQLGIKPIMCTCHGPSIAFYYKDPDNNTVELLADAYDDMEKSFAHMSRPEMRTNPMGTYVDPAKVQKARKAGADLDDLRERALAGEFKPETIPDPLASW